jgi:hypothetical protein
MRHIKTDMVVSGCTLLLNAVSNLNYYERVDRQQRAWQTAEERGWTQEVNNRLCLCLFVVGELTHCSY